MAILMDPKWLVMVFDMDFAQQESVSQAIEESNLGWLYSKYKKTSIMMYVIFYFSVKSSQFEKIEKALIKEFSNTPHKLEFIIGQGSLWFTISKFIRQNWPVRILTEEKFVLPLYYHRRHWKDYDEIKSINQIKVLQFDKYIDDNKETGKRIKFVECDSEIFSCKKKLILSTDFKFNKTSNLCGEI